MTYGSVHYGWHDVPGRLRTVAMKKIIDNIEWYLKKIQITIRKALAQKIGATLQIQE